MNQFGEPVPTDDPPQSEYVNQLPPSRDAAGQLQDGAPGIPFRAAQMGHQRQAPARPTRPPGLSQDDGSGPAAALGQGAEAMIDALHGSGQNEESLDEEDSEDSDEARDQFGTSGEQLGQLPTPKPVSPLGGAKKPPSVGQRQEGTGGTKVKKVPGATTGIRHIYLEVQHNDEALMSRYLYLRDCSSTPIKTALATGVSYQCRQSGKPTLVFVNIFFPLEGEGGAK